MGIMYKLMKHRNLTMDLTTKPTSKTKSDKCRLLTIDGHIIETSSAKNNYNEPPQQKTEREVEKRFTAEHILQLCKFLAEKSKRNKNLYTQQQSPKKLSKTQKHFQFQSMDYDECDNNDNYNGDNFDDNNVHLYDEHDQHNECTDDMHQNEAIPLLSTFRRHHQKSSEVLQMTSTVLSSRLSPDINALNISSSCPTATMPSTATNQQHHGNNEQQHSLRQHQQQTHQQQHYLQQGKRDILLKIRHQIFERKRLREKGYEPQALQVSTQVWRPW